MNIHRKLLVLGLNELLAREALSLDPQVPVTAGHLFATLAGHPSVIVWHEINCEELSLAVWWKYDHSKHPQANLEGNQRESFSGAAPLAKPQHYSKFVGAVAACWVERRTGRYLQGSGARGLYEVYTRRGEADELKAIPKPIPQGFEVEGKFFL